MMMLAHFLGGNSQEVHIMELGGDLPGLALGLVGGVLALGPFAHVACAVVARRARDQLSLLTLGTFL